MQLRSRRHRRNPSHLREDGGKIVMPKLTIPTVGTLIFFQDPKGNLAGAMQYEKSPA